MKENQRTKLQGSKAFTIFNDIELKNIYFKYDGTDSPVLNNVSLKINKGEFIGVLGESGSGKTTMLNIIAGILNPSRGQVNINGNDIVNYKSDSISTVFGYVGQEPFLFNDTIRHNILFGRQDIGEEEIVNALRKAELFDYVKTLPNYLDYVVADEGIKFSGGQRQRLILARALVDNPSVLLLDEATSALDQPTEERIMKTIVHYINKEDKTVIFVTHRKTALKNADKIICMRAGKVESIVDNKKIA